MYALQMFILSRQKHDIQLQTHIKSLAEGETVVKISSKCPVIVSSETR